MEASLFTWIDYLLFSLMLILSALVGVYFGFYEKKQNNTTDYLLGGKTMKILPVAMSLLASHMSGITILGIPAEVYSYGMYYSTCFITAIFLALAVAYVYMPVFYKLQLPCSFDYLRLRFDKRCQMLASIMYVVEMILYIPVVIYVPALTFSQVTGLSIHLITPITCIICVFYTTVGGLKAVVWTDALQLTITIGALVAVLILGVNHSGGLAHILEISDRGGRLEFFNTVFDVTDRTSLWGIVIGMTFGWTQYIAVSQISVQRFLAVPTMQAARKSVMCLCIGHFLIKFITCSFGLLLYAKYADCDPLLSNQTVRRDQIMPLYVTEITKDVPGLPGLFTAGVFCAALSSMSSGLNSLAATVYEDYVMPFMPEKTTEKRASDIMKLIVVLLGTLCTSMVFMVEKMGSIFQLTYTLSGITAGPALGLYSLGMLVPFANTKGALTGTITSMLFMSVVIFGSQYHTSQGYHHPTKPFSVDGCNATNITTMLTETLQETHDPPFLFKLSFYYYTMLGTLILMFVGVIVSKLTDEKKEVNRDYLSPVIYWALPKQKQDADYNIVSTNNPTKIENEDTDRKELDTEETKM